MQTVVIIACIMKHRNRLGNAGCILVAALIGMSTIAGCSGCCRKRLAEDFNPIRSLSVATEGIHGACCALMDAGRLGNRKAVKEQAPEEE